MDERVSDVGIGRGRYQSRTYLCIQKIEDVRETKKKCEEEGCFDMQSHLPMVDHCDARGFQR